MALAKQVSYAKLSLPYDISFGVASIQYCGGFVLRNTTRNRDKGRYRIAKTLRESCTDGPLA